MNTTLQVIPTSSNLAYETGPRFIGALLQWGLFGTLCTQVYLYYIAFQKDPLRVKIFVFLVFTLEFVQTVMITSSAFNVFAAGFGDNSAYDQIELVWFSIPLMSGIVAFMAQSFYAYRISVLAESYWVAALVMVFAVLQLSGSIASAVVVKRAKLFSRLLGRPFFITSGIWNGGSAVCDVIIAVAMTYYLWKRGSSGLKSTQLIVRRVMTLVIETGIVTAVFAILTLVLTNLPNHPTYYQVPSAILAKVYSNSMMVLLNSRIKLVVDASGPPSEDTNMIGLKSNIQSTGHYELGNRITVTNHGPIIFNDMDPERKYRQSSQLARGAQDNENPYRIQ